MEDKTEKEIHTCRGWCCCGGGGGIPIFGLFLIVIGGYFLARDLGWIAGNISFWPAVALLFGIYFVARTLKR